MELPKNKNKKEQQKATNSQQQIGRNNKHWQNMFFFKNLIWSNIEEKKHFLFQRVLWSNLFRWFKTTFHPTGPTDQWMRRMSHEGFNCQWRRPEVTGESTAADRYRPVDVLAAYGPTSKVREFVKNLSDAMAGAWQLTLSLDPHSFLWVFAQTTRVEDLCLYTLGIFLTFPYPHNDTPWKAGIQEHVFVARVVQHSTKITSTCPKRPHAMASVDDAGHVPKAASFEGFWDFDPNLPCSLENFSWSRNLSYLILS